MQREDLPAGLLLSSQAGWNQSLGDWELIFDLGKPNNWVAVIDNEIVGTVTSIKFSDHFDWVAMMVIDPKHRRKGIGISLMQKVIIESSTGLVRLDASEMGIKLYEKLGFEVENKLTRFKSSRPSKNLIGDSREIYRIESPDFDSIATYDFANTALDRSDLLRSLGKRGPGWIYRSNQTLQGFLLARLGRSAMYIGPIVAANIEIARSLLHHALNHLPYRPIVLDVFAHSRVWIETLREDGFEIDRNFTRMQLGQSVQIFLTKSQFAISGPALG